MDELELDNLEKDINNKDAVGDRIRNLHKSKKEAEDKFELAEKARTDAEAKVATMEKETKFLNSFSDSITKYPGATEYKDKIKEKFNSGYSLDDAVVSILVSEGKYTPPTQPKESAAGGSAPNQITGNPKKTVQEMNKDEKLAALREAEQRGDLSV